MTISAEIASIERRVAVLDPSPSPGDAGAWADAVGGATSAPRAIASPAARDALVGDAAAAEGIDPALLYAIIENESGFDVGATSPAGAQGLAQLMPATASELGVSDPYDPAQSAAGGARYLHALLDRFGGNVALAVAAYNAGPAAVEHYGGVPPYAETQRYVGNVIAALQRLHAHI